MILNVTAPIKIPAEKGARSARNLKGWRFSLLITEAIKNGDATNNDITIVNTTESKFISLNSIILESFDYGEFKRQCFCRSWIKIKST
jgi:hypothetical protein